MNIVNRTFCQGVAKGLGSSDWGRTTLYGCIFLPQDNGSLNFFYLLCNILILEKGNLKQ